MEYQSLGIFWEESPGFLHLCLGYLLNQTQVLGLYIKVDTTS
jgi:hypothetical protein